jgi:hypothetical protein
MSKFAHGRVCRFAFWIAGGLKVATTCRRDVIDTLSPFRMSRRTEGNALRICRTVAVFMSHKYVSPTSLSSASTKAGHASIVVGSLSQHLEFYHLRLCRRILRCHRNDLRPAPGVHDKRARGAGCILRIQPFVRHHADRFSGKQPDSSTVQQIWIDAGSFHWRVPIPQTKSAMSTIRGAPAET